MFRQTWEFRLERFPDNVDFQYHWGYRFNRLGRIMGTVGNLAEAEAERGKTLMGKLFGGTKTHPVPPAAQEQIQQALALVEQLLKIAPENKVLQKEHEKYESILK